MKNIVVVAVGLLTSSLHLGFAEEDIMVRPPKPVRDGNELTRLVRDTRVGEASYHKILTVFPLFTSGRGERGYWTMDQALAKGVLRITEKGEASVPELLAENLSDEPVFLMAGEIVTGGKQNRVISQDILLPPRSGPIGLGVFCVEHGRWTKQTERFSDEKELAHGKLREQLSSPAISQSAVWDEVARKSEAVAPATKSETGYLGRMYEDRDLKRNIDEYSKAITIPRDANGMAVVIGGQVVGVEIFGDRETFGKLRDKLLRSYAVDAIEHHEREKPSVGREIVERFLRRAEDVRLESKRTIGLGRLFTVEGAAKLYGTVLVWHEQNGAHGVVHTSLFSEGGR